MAGPGNITVAPIILPPSLASHPQAAAIQLTIQAARASTSLQEISDVIRVAQLPPDEFLRSELLAAEGLRAVALGMGNPDEVISAVKDVRNSAVVIVTSSRREPINRFAPAILDELREKGVLALVEGAERQIEAKKEKKEKPKPTRRPQVRAPSQSKIQIVLTKDFLLTAKSDRGRFVAILNALKTLDCDAIMESKYPHAKIDSMSEAKRWRSSTDYDEVMAAVHVWLANEDALDILAERARLVPRAVYTLSKMSIWGIERGRKLMEYLDMSHFVDLYAKYVNLPKVRKDSLIALQIAARAGNKMALAALGGRSSLNENSIITTAEDAFEYDKAAKRLPEFLFSGDAKWNEFVSIAREIYQGVFAIYFRGSRKQAIANLHTMLTALKEGMAESDVIEILQSYFAAITLKGDYGAVVDRFRTSREHFLVNKEIRGDVETLIATVEQRIANLAESDERKKTIKNYLDELKTILKDPDIKKLQKKIGNLKDLISWRLEDIRILDEVANAIRQLR